MSDWKINQQNSDSLGNRTQHDQGLQCFFYAIVAIMSTRSFHMMRPLNASSPGSPSAPSSQSSAPRSKTPSQPCPSRSLNTSILRMRAVRFSWAWRFWSIHEGGERGSRDPNNKLTSLIAWSARKQRFVDVEKVARAWRRTDAWELGAAVTALWRTALLLGVLVLEFSAGCLNDADFVGTCIVPGGT